MGFLVAAIINALAAVLNVMAYSDSKSLGNFIFGGLATAAAVFTFGMFVQKVVG